MSKLVQTCLNWFKLVYSCSNLYILVQTCLILFKLVYSCLLLASLMEKKIRLFFLIPKNTMCRNTWHFCADFYFTHKLSVNMQIICGTLENALTTLYWSSSLFCRGSWPDFVQKKVPFGGFHIFFLFCSDLPILL